MSPLIFELIRPHRGVDLHAPLPGRRARRGGAGRGASGRQPRRPGAVSESQVPHGLRDPHADVLRKGLLPPHVAAGINLAFWPFGAIARWCGGFFIRRSFKGDHLYGAVLRAYVKRLIRDGFPQEFFIEGGRSRTGKLASPKTGLLAMEVEAWHEESEQDLSFVPIAIDYEKLPEGKSYARELGGGEKQKESFWSLLEARRRCAHATGASTYASISPHLTERARPRPAASRAGRGGPAPRLHPEPGQPHRLRHQPRQHPDPRRPVRDRAAERRRRGRGRRARATARPVAPDRAARRRSPGGRAGGRRVAGSTRARCHRRGAGPAGARRSGRGARRRRRRPGDRARLCRPAPAAAASWTSFATT